MSWTDKIDTLIDRWHDEAEGAVALAEPAFEVDLDAAPDMDWLVRETRRGLAELAEAVRDAGGARAPAAAPAGAPVVAAAAAGAGPELAEFREDIKTALARFAETMAAQGARPAAPAGVGQEGLREEIGAALAGLREEVGSALSGLRRETGTALARLGESPPAEGAAPGGLNEEALLEFREEIKTALADFAEENMVGRAGLTKGLKIGMADLAEKNRRAMAELTAALEGANKSAGGADTISFYPEPVADQSFEAQGDAGAFVGEVGEDGGRRISVPNCYAAQVNDDSMAPLASEGQTLLVSRAIPARNGDLVLAQLADGTWIFKRYILRGEEHQLHSINPQLGLPAIVLNAPPQRMHVVVAVLFGRVLVRAREAAESSAAAGVGAASD